MAAHRSGMEPLTMTLNNFVLFQFHKEFLRWCPSAKGFLVEWEDAAPIVIEWARTKSNPVAAMIVEELFRNGKPSLG